MKIPSCFITQADSALQYSQGTIENIDSEIQSIESRLKSLRERREKEALNVAELSEFIASQSKEQGIPLKTERYISWPIVPRKQLGNEELMKSVDQSVLAEVQKSFGDRFVTAKFATAREPVSSVGGCPFVYVLYEVDVSVKESP